MSWLLNDEKNHLFSHCIFFFFFYHLHIALLIIHHILHFSRHSLTHGLSKKMLATDPLINEPPVIKRL